MADIIILQVILNIKAESRAKELTQDMDFSPFVFRKESGQVEGKGEKKQCQLSLPSVPVTGLLWHLRMVTSNLPFLFIENKIYKVIHTFFSFFVYFLLVCFLLTLKIGNIQNTLFFNPTSFFHYLQICTRKS